MKVSKIEEEKRVVTLMIAIYCHAYHKRDKDSELCPECLDLLSYSLDRLDRCPFGEEKGSCSCCSVHCYKPTKRQQIAEVMRYSGKRMIIYSPLAALKHMWQIFSDKYLRPKQVKK